MYIRCHQGSGSYLIKLTGGAMKLVSLAIGSLGVWVLLNSFLAPQSIWEDIVFGGIAAVLAVIEALKNSFASQQLPP